MKSPVALISIAVLVVLLTCIAGCTTTSSTPAATAPVATTSASGSSGATVTAPAVGTAVSATSSTATSGIDSTISVHFNDYACINIPKALGVDYLYPGENYSIWVTTPGSGTITPNLLVLNVNDNARFGTVTPVWDAVQKTWTYEGIVPLVKLIDITTPQSETLTIKNQGWYFVCIDDRKESGVSDAVYNVPVKVTRI
ncbi:MAG: hypothetical protein WCE46_04105 [Methanoregula sp.]|uniref:hypothetical protein n=1 Tax=Methanoregula sp. TaxID=2052170 RepID=UPI003C784C20